jgi:hypothetical protein
MSCLSDAVFFTVDHMSSQHNSVKLGVKFDGAVTSLASDKRLNGMTTDKQAWLS